MGDKINIEIDPQTQAIVDTVERVLNQKEQEKLLQQAEELANVAKTE